MLRSVDLARNILSRKLVPFFELGVLEIDIVVKDGLGCGESWSLKLLLPPVGEFLSVLATVFEIKSSTEAPDAAEDKYECQSLNSRVLEDALKELAQGNNHADFYLRNQIFECSLDVLEGFFNVLIEVALELLLALTIVVLLLKPRLYVSLPLVAGRVRDEENTGTGDGSWRGEP